jgi:hypothetical protein
MDSVITTKGTVTLMKLFRESALQSVLEVGLRFDPTLDQQSYLPQGSLAFTGKRRKTISLLVVDPLDINGAQPDALRTTRRVSCSRHAFPFAAFIGPQHDYG